ncbi:MAG: alpha-ribazole phosphatase [Anaerolineales bacterium]
MPRIYLVRHGETRANAEMRYQGQNDTPLSEAGIEQAQRLAERLRSEAIERLICSDLARAWQTAEPVAQALGLAITPDERLREIDVGEWEGLTFGEIEQRYPALAAEWDHAGPEVRIPGGESANDVARRAEAVLAELRSAPDESSILLVTHGGWVQTFMCVALGVELQRRYQFRVRNTAVSIVSLYGEFALLDLFNDAHHLKGLAG